MTHSPLVARLHSGCYRLNRLPAPETRMKAATGIHGTNNSDL